jgi:D-glycero-D-manno-heptose 1,7-bisphosphate phosphatase
MKRHRMNLNDLYIDRSWTLFLDRDGVINRKLPGDYVKTWTEFEFLPGVIPALVILRHVFGKLIIATNQQGIGKGLMTEEDLSFIHNQMQRELMLHNVTITRIYHSPHLASTNHFMRKPRPGMAFRAREEFPSIDLEKAIMVGDSESDIMFGKSAGMRTVLITQTEMFIPTIKPDFTFPSLIDFARQLKSLTNIGSRTGQSH